jgi:hypothetical protein
MPKEQAPNDPAQYGQAKLHGDTSRRSVSGIGTQPPGIAPSRDRIPWLG